MSASRMPAFSPSAAKPSARLQEVVDLPTPPLPEATAMTCLTPGMPGGFRRRAGLHGGLSGHGSRLIPYDPKRIALLGVARAQIILCRHDRRARCGAACGSKLSLTTASTRQSAHILTTSMRLALAPWNIQCFSPSLASTRVDRAFGAERLAAGDAMEGLFFLQHA